MMFIIVHKMYSKNIHSNGSSPNSCGIFLSEYDAMNPTEKNNRFTHTNTHRFKHHTNIHRRWGRPASPKTPAPSHHQSHREKDAYSRYRLVPPEHTFAILAQLWA